MQKKQNKLFKLQKRICKKKSRKYYFKKQAKKSRNAKKYAKKARGVYNLGKIFKLCTEQLKPTVAIN